MLRQLWAYVAIGCVVAVGLASCGGKGSQSQGKGPANVVPPDAAAYVDVTVRPRPKQRAPMRRALGRLFAAQDPAPALDNFADAALARAGWKTGYEKSVAPWVGGQIAAFTTSFDSGAPVTLVFTVRDRAKALAAARRAGRPAGTYGIVGRFLVSSATTAGYRASVAATHGPSLASSDLFNQALHTAPGGRVAIGYVNSAMAFDAFALRRGLTGDAQALLRQRLGALVRAPVMIALRPAEITALTADVSFRPVTPASALPSGSTQILGRSPVDSTAALGVANLGDFIRHQIEQTDAAGRRAAAIAAHLHGGAGFDLQRDALDWLDDSAGFVQGTNPKALQGAVTFDSTDKDESKAAAKRLAPLAPPGVLIGARGERVIVAHGGKAFAWALHPKKGKGRLSSLGRFRTAKENLDFALSGFVNVRRALALLAARRVASDPLYRAVLPYLQRLTYLGLGWGSSRGRDRIRVLAGLEETK